jgi:hypothetical protein
MATAIHPDDMHGISAPIRDDHALGSTHRDRRIDDTPPCVVGLTAFFAVLLAMVCGAVFATGGAVGHIAAALLAAIAIPAVVVGLTNHAKRERGEV